MARHRIPDFFDAQSRRLALSILAGKTPLVDVNRPGVSPNVLRFFQDPKNRALITRTGGFDVAANQAAVDARVKDAKRAIFAKRGTPRRVGKETQEQMADRLQRGGLNLDIAVLAAGKRFRLNADLEQRRADRTEAIADLDERRRAAGLPTSVDRESQRLEAQRRIIERRQGPSVLDDINRQRIARGRKPFGPVVREEAIPIQSLDEVDPTVHGSGQDFVTPDGDAFRLIITPSGDQIHVPLRRDPRTGQLIIDDRQINIDEFKEALTKDERHNRIQTVLDSGTIYARDLQGILNNMAGLGQAVRDGTAVEATKQEQLEKLQDDLDELLFDFADKIGFVPESQRQTEEEIEQREAEAKVQQDKEKAEIKAEADIRKAEVGMIAGLVTTVTKELEAIAKAKAGKEVGGVPRKITDEEIREEVRKRFEIIKSLTEDSEEASLEKLKPPREGTPLLQFEADKIRDHVLKFHAGKDLREQRRIAAEIAQTLGFIAG